MDLPTTVRESMNGNEYEDQETIILTSSGGEKGELLFAELPKWVAGWVGAGPSDLIGKPLAEVFGGFGEGIVSVAEEVLRTGRPIVDRYAELTDKSGREWALLLDLRPRTRKGTEGRESSVEIVARLTDVTETVESRRKVLLKKSYYGIIGHSPAMLQVYNKIEVYGPSDGPVVITGETGTGKELVASALHACSRRRNKPFVAVNCCALSEELFESELFGHEKGSFTGAMRTHRGRFERAHEGTLLLDEIGDMSPRIQAKLLRVLEESKLERVGGEKEIPVDVRVIASTNTSLDQAVALGRFRADLFHRLAVFRIHVPPLRERVDDISLLVEHFLEVFNSRYNRRIERLSPDAMKVLMDYYWPGNIRELRNVLERVYVETQGSVIGGKVLETWERERDSFIPGGWNLQNLDNIRMQTPPIIPPWVRGRPALPAPGADRSLPSFAHPNAGQPFNVNNMKAPIDAVYQVIQQPAVKSADLSEDDIRKAFLDAQGNLSEAARRLGVHKATLYRRMRTLGLTRETLESGDGDTGS